MIVLINNIRDKSHIHDLPLAGSLKYLLANTHTVVLVQI